MLGTRNRGLCKLAIASESSAVRSVFYGFHSSADFLILGRDLVALGAGDFAFLIESDRSGESFAANSKVG